MAFSSDLSKLVKNDVVIFALVTAIVHIVVGLGLLWLPDATNLLTSAMLLVNIGVIILSAIILLYY
jgi:hypothetical protein